jgi:hypothetical protein
MNPDIHERMKDPALRAKSAARTREHYKHRLRPEDGRTPLARRLMSLYKGSRFESIGLLAEATGYHKNSVVRSLSGAKANPTYHMVEALVGAMGYQIVFVKKEDLK